MKTLSNFTYHVSSEGKIMFNANIIERPNVLTCASDIIPDKDGAAFVKQLNKWVSDYLKTKYGCEK